MARKKSFRKELKFQEIYIINEKTRLSIICLDREINLKK
jgi:hypothetical protein